MTRREALLALLIATALLAGGLAWLLGGYGLVIAGLAVAAYVLFGVNIEERRSSEAVEPAQSTPGRDFPLHL